MNTQIKDIRTLLAKTRVAMNTIIEAEIHRNIEWSDDRCSFDLIDVGVWYKLPEEHGAGLNDALLTMTEAYNLGRDIVDRVRKMEVLQNHGIHMELILDDADFANLYRLFSIAETVDVDTTNEYFVYLNEAIEGKE